MRHQKNIMVFLTLILTLSLFAGCGKTEPASEPADTSITITDMMEREVTLDAPATRVVALTAADCEILYAIGAGDMLVGRGEYCDYPPEVLKVPVVESGANTNIEKIIELDPQLVIMSGMAQTEEQVAALEAAGIKVAVTYAHDIAGVYTAIELIGKLTDKDDEAASVIDSMKSDFEDVTAKAEGKFAGDGTKTVYFEVSPLEYGLWTAGRNTFMDEICEMLGLKNAFGDVDGWGEISEEQVLLRNPDYIVTIAMYTGEGPAPDKEIMARKGWNGITAVKNGEILNLGNNELSRPAPRLADGAKLMYDFIYKADAKQAA